MWHAGVLIVVMSFGQVCHPAILLIKASHPSNFVLIVTFSVWLLNLACGQVSSSANKHSQGCCDFVGKVVYTALCTLEKIMGISSWGIYYYS